MTFIAGGHSSAQGNRSGPDVKSEREPFIEARDHPSVGNFRDSVLPPVGSDQLQQVCRSTRLAAPGFGLRDRFASASQERLRESPLFSYLRFSRGIPWKPSFKLVQVQESNSDPSELRDACASLQDLIRPDSVIGRDAADEQGEVASAESIRDLQRQLEDMRREIRALLRNP